MNDDESTKQAGLIQVYERKQRMGTRNEQQSNDEKDDNGMITSWHKLGQSIRGTFMNFGLYSKINTAGNIIIGMGRDWGYIIPQIPQCEIRAYQLINNDHDQNDDDTDDVAVDDDDDDTSTNSKTPMWVPLGRDSVVDGHEEGLSCTTLAVSGNGKTFAVGPRSKYGSSDKPIGHVRVYHLISDVDNNDDDDDEDDDEKYTDKADGDDDHSMNGNNQGYKNKNKKTTTTDDKFNDKNHHQVWVRKGQDLDDILDIPEEQLDFLLIGHSIQSSHTGSMIVISATYKKKKEEETNRDKSKAKGKPHGAVDDDDESDTTTTSDEISLILTYKYRKGKLIRLDYDDDKNNHDDNNNNSKHRNLLKLPFQFDHEQRSPLAFLYDDDDTDDEENDTHCHEEKKKNNDSFTPRGDGPVLAIGSPLARDNLGMISTYRLVEAETATRENEEEEKEETLSCKT